MVALWFTGRLFIGLMVILCRFARRDSLGLQTPSPWPPRMKDSHLSESIVIRRREVNEVVLPLLVRIIVVDWRQSLVQFQNATWGWSNLVKSVRQESSCWALNLIKSADARRNRVRVRNLETLKLSSSWAAGNGIRHPCMIYACMLQSARICWDSDLAVSLGS